MDSNEWENLFNTILKSNSSLETKVGRILYELRPNGTKEEKINFILYWLNNLIVEDGNYNKITYEDIKVLLNDILEVIDDEVLTQKNYSNYYSRINIIVQRIMSIIYSKKNNLTTSIVEPSSLINMDKLERREQPPTNDVDKVNRIKELYSKKMNAEVRRMELIKQITLIQEQIEEIKRNNQKIDDELAEIFEGGKNNGKK